MELEEFVQKTITEIINGVKAASDQLGDEHVAPKPWGVLPKDTRRNSSDHTIHDIEFDVAVSVEEKNGSDVSGKISVLGYGVGGGIASDKTASTVTRIKFIVPIVYAGRK